MTDPTTTVNSQITDAVTQANVKVLGEAPALAIGNLYQALAHSTGLALQDAVAAQQQLNELALAATAQGIALLYSQDTTAAAAAAERAENPAEALNARVLQAGAALKNTATSAQSMPSQSSINSQIEAAVKLANDSVLENAARFAYALRAAADAATAALDETGRAAQQNNLRLLQTAATSACLQAMLRNPEKADDYAQVMQTIRDLI